MGCDILYGKTNIVLGVTFSIYLPQVTITYLGPSKWLVSLFNLSFFFFLPSL